MKINNPIISGFYPDPSVCYADGFFYLVCSTFQYFPGIPLFRSTDMITWEQIGHVLTRDSQLDLSEARASQGLFAPTIRYHEGRFYMIVTHVNNGGNFIVHTEDIMGEWSDPIFINHGGIDPSLLFDGDKVYYTGTGVDAQGKSGIFQCEIDIMTGEVLTESRCICYGSGGRYVEGPHLYHIGDYYYLLMAEGGTEYGHMITFFRSRDPYGPFESCPHNPILTNRNLGGYAIQGSGHGDLIQDENSQWWMVHLAFRQTSKWNQFHHLGRETFLEPVVWTHDGWIDVGVDGTCRSQYVHDESGWFVQEMTDEETGKIRQNWIMNATEVSHVRNPKRENYQLYENGCFKLKGTKDDLTSFGYPTFAGLRQKAFQFLLDYNIDIIECVVGQEVGFTVYMDEHHHYDIGIKKEKEGTAVFLKLVIGGHSVLLREDAVMTDKIRVRIESTSTNYAFYYEVLSEEEKTVSHEKQFLGEALSKYLSSEVAEGFTGVLVAAYCIGDEQGNSGWAVFEPTGR